MRKLIFLMVAVMLTACDAQSHREPVVARTFEVDGCQVKYIDPYNLPNFYIARCGNTTTTTWKQQAGKSTTTYGAVNVESADELRKRLSEVEAKDRAMAKLSDDDKKALGIK